MPYRFIEHTADIAVEVEAITIDDLFALSCHAWRDAALEEIDTSSIEWRYVSFASENYEELLVQLLNELNFLLYTGKWVFNSIDNLEVRENNNSISLSAEILGEPFNETVHILKEEIKAVTYHQLKIETQSGSFRTRIVFDI